MARPSIERNRSHGKNLLAYLQKGKSLPFRQAAAVVRKGAQALALLHRQGRFYGDLRTSSIVINGGKEPVLLDPAPNGAFQVATSDDPGRRGAGEEMAYLSPEQAAGNGRALSPASDIYRLGVVLYHLLTGRLPFRGTSSAVLAQIQTREPARPTFFRPDLDGTLEAICRKAMAKKPLARYATMDAFAADLTRYLKGEGIATAQLDEYPPPAVGLAVSPPPTYFPAPLPDRVAGWGGEAEPRGMQVWPWVAGIGGLCALLLTTVLIILLSGKTEGTDLVAPEVAQPIRQSAKKMPAEELAKPDDDFTDLNPAVIDNSRPVLRVMQKLNVDTLGNADTQVEIKLPLASHLAFKQKMSHPIFQGKRLVGWRPPRMDNVLRFLGLEDTRAVTEKLEGKFGDEVIEARQRELGWAQHRDGRWVNQLTSDPAYGFRIVKKHGGRFLTLRAMKKEAGLQIVEECDITLPPGSHNIRVEAKPNRLVYETPAPRGEPSRGKPALRLETKPHLMSALYKLYGDPRFTKLYVARGVFRNESAQTITDYRARFRIAGYSAWSRWERCDSVYPGQTVVDVFYPVIDAKVRDLKAQTPADVEAEYEYVLPDGRKVTDTQSERIKILGINEGVFTDLPINEDSTFFEKFKDAALVLGTFTTGTDPVLRDVLGVINKQIGGAGASASDRGAMLFLEALYNLFRANIAYEGAKGDVFDGALHQDLKYGREVFRTKSGTCVNLAIAYASVCEAAGLDAFIIVIPNHAFPAARLPKSGKVVFVETTGCGGGTMERSAPFARVTDYAAKNYQKWAGYGHLIEVNIRQLRRTGVTPPELPDVGANPLEAWKIKVPGPAPGAGSGVTPERSTGGYRVEGLWKARVKNGVSDFLFLADGTFTMRSPATHRLLLRGRYTYAGGLLSLTINGKTGVVTVSWKSANYFTFKYGQLTWQFNRYGA
jgi:hypothetical protein